MLKITPGKAPKIMKISDLKINTYYSVYFNEVDFVTFTTIQKGSENHRSVVVSCDRSFEDYDYETIEKLGNEKLYGYRFIK